jgi:uncharacterized protein (TIGR00255 family)
MQSMTGFGRGVADLEDGRLVVEIKAVNHRFLEVRCRAPRELMAGETIVERMLRDHLSRGYCTVNIWYEGKNGGTTRLDQEALETHLNSLIAVGKKLDLCLADLVPTLAGAPDLFSSPHFEDESDFADSARLACERALTGLTEMRKLEGHEMSKTFSTILTDIEKQIAKLEKLTEKWPGIALERTQERLDALIENAEINIDPSRLAAEAAILVNKADVTEEITRMGSHLVQAQQLLTSKVPIGRKAEFLIQEMGREVNTVGSKAVLPEINILVVETKTGLEKLRELAQNIE